MSLYEESYKVVDRNLGSLCIAGNDKRLQYQINDWTSEPNARSGSCFGGGIWSFKNLGDAKWLAGYVKTHPNPELRRKPRIFKCEIRGIIHRRYRKNGNLYTIKSLEVRLTEEIQVELNGKYHVTKEQRQKGSNRRVELK